MYVARQSTIAYSAKRFSLWTTIIFVISIFYSFYRNHRQIEFRHTVTPPLRFLIVGWGTIYRRQARETSSYPLAHWAWTPDPYIFELPVFGSGVPHWVKPVCREWCSKRVRIRWDFWRGCGWWIWYKWSHYGPWNITWAKSNGIRRACLLE